MSGFAGFRCWTTQDVDETISVEAVTPHAAVFLATHQPLVIARRPVSDADARTEATVVDEQEVLRDFVSRRPVGGVLIMPVIGESGTGKSHLVRWIHEHLPETARRRVAYIRKTDTNLQSVVQELLLDLDGEVFDAIRAEVAKVVVNYDEQRLPGALLNELALSVEHAVVDPTRADARYRQGLVGADRLSALLHDLVFRTPLLAPSGVIARLSSEILRGRRADEAERPFRIEASDLPRDVVEIEKAGAAAKAIARQLAGSDALLDAAVTLLNENLDQAVLRLANLSGGRLQRAMLDLRRELKARDQEIVLLIEDFAVIQGVQGDLLDAITEVSTRGGREELAPIRTMMAVTKGYYGEMAETVRTRAAAGLPHLYSLDVNIGDRDAQVSASKVGEFTGRYLNAARVGRSKLTAARPSEDSAVNEREWVPNACEPCAHRETCHPAFGATEDGYGLYPFNQVALSRTVRSRSGERFNPRAILGQVVRVTLEQYVEDIATGRFPPQAFTKEFPLAVAERRLSADTVRSIQKADPVDHERRVVLLDYWGGAPSAPQNLPDGIHVAFKIAQVGAFPQAGPDEPSGSEPGEGTEGDEQKEPLALRRGRADIDAWFTRGDPLEQTTARTLRSAIREHVVSRVDWNSALLGWPNVEELRQALKDPPVRIEGAAAERGQQDPTAATIRIGRTAEMALLLEAVLVRHHLNHWNFEKGPERARQLAGLCDSWAAKLVAEVRVRRRADDEAVLGAAVHCSLTGAVLMGLGVPRGTDRAPLLRAMFDDGSTATPPKDTSLRAREWQTTVSAHAKARPALIAALRSVDSAAQGDGGAQVVRAGRWLPHVESWLTGADAPIPQDAPDWLGAAQRSLAGVETAVDAQWTVLRTWAQGAEMAFGTDDPKAVLKQLQSTLAAAAGPAGVYQGARAGTVQEQQEGMRGAAGWAWSLLTDVAAAVAQESEQAARWRLHEAAMDRGASFEQIANLVARSHQWLDASLARASVRLQGGAADTSLVLAQLLTALDAALGGLEAGGTR